MADNTNIRQPQDPKKINMNQAWEVIYWTKELKVSEAKLAKAVNAVGVMVTDVKAWLAKN